MIEIKQTIPVTNRNTSSVQFLTFNDQNKIIYNGYCKLKGNTLSKYLHIDSLDEEIKPKSVSFDSNFIKEKHILCILSESKIHDLVLIFQHEKLCQQFLTSINKYRNPSNDVSTEKNVIQDKFFIPAFQQLCDPNIVKILTDLFQLYNQQEKQSFITFLKESGFYDTVKSILLFENYLTHDSGTILNTRKRRHNEIDQCTNNAPMNKRDNKLCLKKMSSTNLAPAPSSDERKIIRQQKESSSTDAEVMQFKASQQLLNPSQVPVKVMKEKMFTLIDVYELVFGIRGRGNVCLAEKVLRETFICELAKHYGLSVKYVNDSWKRVRDALAKRRQRGTKKQADEAEKQLKLEFADECRKEFGAKMRTIKEGKAAKTEKAQTKKLPSRKVVSSSNPPPMLSKKSETGAKAEKDLRCDTSSKNFQTLLEKEMEEADLLVAVAEKGLELTAWQVFAHFGEKYLEHNFCRDCDCRKPVKNDSKCTQNSELEKIEDDIKRQQEQFLNIIDALVKKRSTEKKEGQENTEKKKKDEKAAAKNKEKQPQKKKGKN